ncbi:MAG: MarR family winged helix-turn-helix transcriptional regulator [Candidatus Acidiferrales bacterium]
MRDLRRQPPKKKQRLAWAAYLELTDAAHWIEAKLRVPLDVFGLSREEFRLMVVLHRDGRLKLSEAETKLARSRESMYETVQRAEEFGWVRRGMMHLPAAEVRASRVAKKRRGKPRLGRRVGTIELNPEGERLIGTVLPKQEEMLRSLMAELDSREMKSLIRICGKLRQEDEFTDVRFGAALIRAGEEFDGEERDDESEG